MGKAFGFIEVEGVVAAVDALDIMCKTAEVEFATWERRLGGRLVTIVVTGEVAACTEAVENAVAKAIKKPVCHGVMPNPHEEIYRMVEVSSRRWKKLWAARQAREQAQPETDRDKRYLYTV